MPLPVSRARKVYYMMKYDLGRGEKENWLIAESTFDIAQQGKCEAIFCLGNGYMGLRSATEEAYIKRTPGLFVNGTFNKFQDNEVTELPNFPDLSLLELMLNGQRFSLDSGSVSDYLRVLDLQTGELVRSLVWTSPKGERFALCFRRFVSLANEHVVGLRVEVQALDGNALVELESGINGRVSNSGAQHFEEGDKRLFDMNIMQMNICTIESKVEASLHVAHRYTLQDKVLENKNFPLIDRRYMSVKNRFEIAKGETLQIDKLMTVHTARDLKYAEGSAASLREDALADMRKLLTEGYDVAFQKSKDAWKALWEKIDIQVESSNPYDQLMIRFALYHLNIMVKKDDKRMGIGAKGLTGEGYKGHSFWDTEIFILPYFSFTQPEVAKTLLEYRYLGLKGAREKAKANGFEGAQYPWEAAWIDDGEVTPLWGAADVVTGKQMMIWTGLIEQHITADIIFGLLQYYGISKDEAFMENFGYEMILDTALFWATRATWDADKQKYVLLDVIGPDEYKDHIDNNAFTNYMAHFNMESALQTIEKLEQADNECAKRLSKQFDFASLKEKIKEVCDKLYLPELDENGILPQFDGYHKLKHIDLTKYKQAKTVGTIYNDYNSEQIGEFQVHKQADTLVLFLLKEDIFPAEVKKKNYYFYEARTLHDSSLSKSTHCVLAADLGEAEESYKFFKGCGDIDLGPAMNTSDMGVHTASMGGIWQCAVYGFGGVRAIGNSLRIEPKLPKEWKSLRFPLVWEGQDLLVDISNRTIHIQNRGTKEIKVLLQGENLAIPAGQKIEKAL